jgi:hypothetical protein
LSEKFSDALLAVDARVFTRTRTPVISRVELFIYNLRNAGFLGFISTSGRRCVPARRGDR